MSDKSSPRGKVLRLGYTCVCGERVVAFTLIPGKVVVPEETITVTCSYGHARTISVREMYLLDVWNDEE